MQRDKTTVAIIMRSKNEQPYAERTLQALNKQSYQHYVLYNVDSGSTDGTLEAIECYNKNQKCIVRILPEEYIPGKVLNAMIELTQEPIIVFLNSDAIPLDSRWLENLLKPLFEGKADAVMSRQVARADAYFIVAYDYSRAYSEKHLRKNPNFFSAAACAFKRELWERTKFYSEGFSEDMVWSKACQEKGAKFLLVPESIVEHSHNYTFKQWYQRKFDEGIVESYLYKKDPSLIGQTIHLFKELVRDLLYAMSRGKFWTIPYNMAYRFVAHLGIYLGQVEGTKKFVKK